MTFIVWQPRGSAVNRLVLSVWPAERCSSFAQLPDVQRVFMLHQTLQAADTYVSPYTAEGFNMPVLEAQACGLPVVVTAGGPTDEFTSNATAKRVASEVIKLKGKQRVLLPDLNALADAMIAVVRDVEWRQRARNEARRLVVEQLRLDWRSITARVLSHAARERLHQSQ